MNARELMVGNYINYEQKTHEIISINTTYCHSVWVNDKSAHKAPYKHSYEDIKPITITENWLVKLGFLNEFDIDRRKIFVHQIDKRIACEGMFEIGYAFYDNDELSCYKEFIHQLQNLYFALTGEELTIKNEK